MRETANEQRLINDYGLSKSDFFTIKKDGEKPKTILRRTGVDKIMEEVDMVIDEFKVETKLVPGFCISTATIKAHLAGDLLNKAWTCASASPDDCLHINKRYAETAETRAKHRAVLSLLGLYKHGIETVDASSNFETKDPDAKENVQEIAEAKEAVRPKNLASQLQKAMDNLNENRKKSKK
jgi:hypothetical protein